MKPWFIVPVLLSAGGLLRAQSADLQIPLQKRVLDNGLTVFLVERHQAPVFAARIAFRVGGADEVTGRTGTAHLLEHMLFKGTRSVGLKNPGDAATENAWLEKEDQLWEAILHEQDSLAEVSAQSVYTTGKATAASSEKLESLKKEFADAQTKHAELTTPNAFSALYDQAGASGMNAGTSNDFTFYEVALPKNRFEFWARMESDRINAPVLREFYTERDVVKEERRMRTDDSPEGRLREMFLGQAFIAHPYGRPVVGWLSDLYALKRTEVQDFYRRYYAPNRTAIVLVGDLTWNEIIPVLDAYFGQLQRQPDPAPVRTVEPPQQGERRLSMGADATPVLMVGWHIPAASHPDFPALNMLADVLARGRGSRLYKNAVEGLSVASSFRAGAGEPGSRYPGLFIVTGTAKGEANPGTLGGVLVEQIDAIKKNGPTEAELKRQVVMHEMDRVKRLENPDQLATDFAVSWAITGDERAFMDDMDRYRAVTGADVQRVAKTYLVDTNRTAAVLLRSKDEEAELALNSEIEELLIKVVTSKGNAHMRPSEVVDPQMVMIRSKPRSQREEIRDGLKKQLEEMAKDEAKTPSNLGPMVDAKTDVKTNVKTDSKANDKPGKTDGEQPKKKD